MRAVKDGGAKADLLRPGAGAGQAAGALRRRRAGHRGHGGGRPYRPGLDHRAGPGDPAAHPRGAGLRRRRHRPRRGDPGAIWRWARPACSSARASSAPPSRSPIRSFKQAFIRAAARDAVPSVQLDPRFPGDPGARPRQRRRPSASSRPSARRHRPVQRAASSTKKAAQLAIEHFWAGALRRAVIDGDVENGSLMAGQSVGMVTARAADRRDPRGTGRPGGARRIAGAEHGGAGSQGRVMHARPAGRPAARLLLRRLRDLMAEGGTAQERLDDIVRIIAADMVAEVCSVYVMRAGEVLELFATEGPEAGGRAPDPAAGRRRAGRRHRRARAGRWRWPTPNPIPISPIGRRPARRSITR